MKLFIPPLQREWQWYMQKSAFQKIDSSHYFVEPYPGHYIPVLNEILVP